MLRGLNLGDEEELEAFLAERADSSMFLRSNLRLGGIVDRGEPHQAAYVGAFEDRRLVAVAAHCWNGMLLVQARRYLPAAARLAAERSGRPVAGIAGPRGQALQARRALGLAAAPTRNRGEEDLLALDLEKLRVPEPLARGEVLCRAPEEADLPLLADWRAAYLIEVFRVPDDPALRAAAREEIGRLQALGRQWILTEGGRPVSYCAFNAALPDIAQVGGVWTPPELRGKGHARAAVAGALLRAGEEGVRRAVLFTERGSPGAQRAYRALGFETAGDFALVVFSDPRPIGKT